MSKRISRLQRIAQREGFVLRKYRNQLDPDSSWDLIDIRHGFCIFGGPAPGYYGAGLEEVEAYLRTT